MSEPWPPAFMRTAPPTDPGTPTAQDSPLHPASATRRASTGSATAAPARTTAGARHATGRNRAPAGRCRRSPHQDAARSPSNPSSATSRLEPRPKTKTGGGGAPRRRVLAARPGAPRPGRRVPRPRRRAPPFPRRRRSSAGPAACPAWPGRRGRRPGRAVRRRASPPSLPCCHHRGDSSSWSGRVVRSPAPRVRQRSPGRSSAATVWRSSSHPAA